jgi:tetratricopeptide (TPR) repeat protein
MSERVQTLRTFLASDPDDSFSRYALALEYRKIGDYEGCMRELEILIKKDPNYVGAYYHLGKAYVLCDDPQKAIQVYNEGIEIATRTSDLHSLKELKEALIEVELDVD